MDWDDVKYFLAVARGGTLGAAARRLKVNQSTVTRHLERFEAAMEEPLFLREDRRLVLTDMGETVYALAEKMELDVLALMNAASDRDAAMSGPVRITAVESLINNFILPRLVGLTHLYPGIRPEFRAESGNLMIDRREADIAIRLARPAEGDMLISKLGDVGLAIYGRQDNVRAITLAQWQGLAWVTYDDSLSHVPEMQWLQEKFPNLDVTVKCNSAVAVASAIQAGAGIGILPCLLGDRIDELERLTGPDPLLFREAWMILHRETSKIPRIRATANWLKELFAKQARVLEGRPLI